MNSNIALLVPANLWFCPFVNIYTKLLTGWNKPYDIIYWDKNNETDHDDCAYHGSIGNSSVQKFIEYFKFSRFIKKKLRTGKYSKVIVFSSQIGIFIAKYLKQYFGHNYIFDFRDLSIEQRRLFHQPFNTLLENSYANVISSPGFKQCLPQKYNYFLSHNFDINQVKNNLKFGVPELSKDNISILTIGGIRDFESNAPLMDSIGNLPNYVLNFVGKGPSARDLEKYALSKGYKNVNFDGYYKKEDEPRYIKASTFLNIYYPDLLSHKTALSNRFYNSIIYRKPMIVTKGQIQGDYCDKYNLGVSVEDITTLPNLIESWLDSFDAEAYDKRCIEALCDFLSDYEKFKNMLKSFCEK